MDPTLEVLKHARELITPKERWTKYFSAVDARGEECPPQSCHAQQFCAQGAIYHCWKVNARAYAAMEVACVRLFGSHHVTDINDGPDGHARILQAFDYAIAEEEKR